jgi:endonuclease YncB( thermonuclease family)
MWRTLPVLLLVASTARAEAPARVVGVKDGDTIEVFDGRTKETVRLWGIDCPEMGQPFGKAAKRFVSDVCFGKPVKLEGRGRDRYGRLLAIVGLPDGPSLNALLVKEGLAWWYYSFAPKALDLAVLEREAKRGRRGLWADPEAVPPWSWRKLRRRLGS